MAKVDKTLLREVLDNLVAGGGGFASGATFGLSDRFAPDYVTDQMNEHPMARGAGELASILNPWAPEAKLAGMAVKKYGPKAMQALVDLGLHAYDADNKLTRAGKLAGSAGEGAFTGATTSAAQSTGRKYLGGDEGANPVEDTQYGTLAGLLMGPLAQKLASSSERIYAHPAFTSGVKGADEGVMDLLNRSGYRGGKFVGSIKSAEGIAEKEMGAHRALIDDVMPRAQAREKALTSLANEKAGANTHFGQSDAKLSPSKSSLISRASEDSDFQSHLNDVSDKLTRGDKSYYPENRRTSLERINSSIHDVNEALLPHSKAFNPDAATTKEIGRLKGIKGSLESSMEKNLSRFSSPEDAQEIAVSARSRYRPGKNLQTNIDEYRRGNRTKNPIQAGGGSSARNIVSSVMQSVFDNTLGSAPIRTAVGAAAEKASPGYAGAVGGKTVENYRRDNRNDEYMRLFKYINGE